MADTVYSYRLAALVCVNQPDLPRAANVPSTRGIATNVVLTVSYHLENYSPASRE